MGIGMWQMVLLSFQLTFFLPIYLLPGIIGQLRKLKQAKQIWLLNILLGWTGLGWLAAGAWAIFGETETSATQPSPPPAAPE
jgi:hypothetical protein